MQTDTKSIVFLKLATSSLENKVLETKLLCVYSTSFFLQWSHKVLARARFIRSVQEEISRGGRRFIARDYAVVDYLVNRTKRGYGRLCFKTERFTVFYVLVQRYLTVLVHINGVE